MTAQLDLFGESVQEAIDQPAYHYRETYDPNEPACCDCRHVQFGELPEGHRTYAQVVACKDRCKRLHIVVDADMGLCDGFESRWCKT